MDGEKAMTGIESGNMLNGLVAFYMIILVAKRGKNHLASDTSRRVRVFHGELLLG